MEDLKTNAVTTPWTGHFLLRLDGEFSRWSTTRTPAKDPNNQPRESTFNRTKVLSICVIQVRTESLSVILSLMM